MGSIARLQPEGFTMQMHTVSWTIDIEADTPHEAALEAFGHMQRQGTTANVFDVTDAAGTTTRVDLDEGTDEEKAELAEQERIELIEFADRKAINALPVSDTLKSVLIRAMQFHNAEFDGREDRDLSVSGSDTVDWFGSWRIDLRNAVAPA